LYKKEEIIEEGIMLTVFKALMAICVVVYIYKCMKEKNTERAYDYLFSAIGFEILSLVERII